MSFGLSGKILTQFKQVFEKYEEIQEVIIYGSRAKGNFRPGSDIDLVLKGENVTDEIRSKVWLELDELNTPYLVDLAVFQELSSQNLIEHIQRVGQVFYKRLTAKKAKQEISSRG